MYTKALILVLLGVTLVLARPETDKTELELDDDRSFIGDTLNLLYKKAKELASQIVNLGKNQLDGLKNRYEELKELSRKELEKLRQKLLARIEEAKKFGGERYEQTKERLQKAFEEEKRKIETALEELRHKLQLAYEAFNKKD